MYRNAANENEPIRGEILKEVTQKAKTSVLSVHASMQSDRKGKQLKQLNSSNQITDRVKMQNVRDLSNSKISRVYVQANYDADNNIQKIIRLFRDKNEAVISRVPPPWSVKFNSFSVDSQNLIYMDQ